MSADEYYRLGVALARQNKISEAFEALEECVTLDPDHRDACKELARLSLEANEVRAFVNWLHEAQRIDEADPEPHLMLAEHLAARKRWAEADMEIRVALRKNPTQEMVDRLAAIQARLPEYI